MCLEIKFRRIDYNIECDSLSNDRSVNKSFVCVGLFTIVNILRYFIVYRKYNMCTIRFNIFYIPNFLKLFLHRYNASLTKVDVKQKKKMGGRENCLKVMVVNIFSNLVQLGTVDGSLRKQSVIAAIAVLHCTHIYAHAYNISFMLYNFNRIFIKPWQFKQHKVF